MVTINQLIKAINKSELAYSAEAFTSKSDKVFDYKEEVRELARDIMRLIKE